MGISTAQAFGVDTGIVVKILPGILKPQTGGLASLLFFNFSENLFIFEKQIFREQKSFTHWFTPQLAAMAGAEPLRS